jgi:glycosyltransferase involved in cell wall biosynthesis
VTLISFAMAARNAESFIGEALDSVAESLGGTGADFEVVLADGDSGDRTVESALARPFVRLVSTSDAGIYDGMNRAIQAARGEFLLILNSDDQLVAEGVRAALARLYASRKLKIVSGAALEGGSIRDAKTLRHEGALTLAGAAFGVPVINARVFRRSLFDELGLFRTDIDLGADREFMIRLAAHSLRGEAIEQPLYFYRRHTGSQTMANDHAGQARVYRAEAAAAAYCCTSYDSLEIRKLCAAARAVANLKLRRIGGAPVGTKPQPFSPSFLLDCARGLWLWRRWRGRTSGA